MKPESTVINFDQNYDSLPRLSFRSVARQDIPALKLLHDILFPVKYSDSFYEGLLGPQFYTYLAFDCGCDASIVGSAGCPRQERVPGGKCRRPILVAVATGRLNTERGVSCRRYNEGYIMTLGVAPEVRNAGLGSHMLQAIVARLLSAACTRVTLHVKEDNSAAIRMYTRFGFKVIERLEDHYHIEGKLYNALTLAYDDPGTQMPCRIL